MSCPTVSDATAVTMPTPLTPSAAQQLLEEVDYVLFDVDGVIWAGDHVFYQVPATLHWLAVTMGKKVRFMTNNATRTRAATRDEFIEKGFSFVTKEMVYSSAFVAALALKDRWRERREEETQLALAALAASSNPFDKVGDTENGTNDIKGSDIVEATLFQKEHILAKHSSDRFPHNVFVIGEKGLHDELREVALAPNALTVGLELVPNPHAEHALLRAVAYPQIVRALREPLIPVGARVLKCAAARGDGDTDGVISGGTITCASHAPESMYMSSVEELNCGAVIVGLDRNINMLKTSIASLVLQRAERHSKSNNSASGSVSATRCDFIVTNEDQSITIGEEGYHFPGAGSCVAMLKAATGLTPDFVCGKPYQRMAEVFMAHEGVSDPRRCLMVGDRLTTDIMFGRGMGARTLMVLTGAESMRDIEAAPANIRPEFVAQSAASLMYVTTP